MEKITKTIYKAYDGTEFDSAIDCKEYETDKELHIYDLLKEISNFCATAAKCSCCPFYYRNEEDKVKCRIGEKVHSSLSPNLWKV